MSGLSYRLRLASDPEGMHILVLNRAVRQACGIFGDRELATLLDYGCGERPHARELSRIAREHIGVDIGENSNADMAIQPEGALPFEDGHFDCVTSFQVLEHVANYTAYLDEAARVCRPGGVLLLSVPFVWPYHPHPTDYRRWTPAGLELDLSRAGFVVEKKWPVLNPFSTALQFALSGIRYLLWNRNAGLRAVARLIALACNPLILLSEIIIPGTVTERLGPGNQLVLARKRV